MLTPEERELREKYVEEKCKLFKEAETCRNQYIHSYLTMKNAHQRLLEIEDEMWTLLVDHVAYTEKLHHLDDSNEMVRSLHEPATQEQDERKKDLFGWHLGSEFPEGCKGMDDPNDRIYLIEPKDGQLAYISRWWGEEHWKKYVNQWQYILPPKRRPS